MLLIDCGNTALKCRWLVDDETIDRTFSLSETASEQLFVAALDGQPTDSIYLASVASEQTTRRVQALVNAACPDRQVQQLLTHESLGQVINAYQEFQRLGVDRWLTLLAAHEITEQGAIIIDAGSAITIDLLTADGHHLGGGILPGFNTSLERFTSIFPAVDFTHSEIDLIESPGLSTEAAINIRQIPTSAGQVAEIVDQWRELAGDRAEILLCGQDADEIARVLDSHYKLVPDLVFQGMLQQIRLTG